MRGRCRRCRRVVSRSGAGPGQQQTGSGEYVQGPRQGEGTAKARQRGRTRRENHDGGPATRTLNGEAGTAATAASPASPLRLDDANQGLFLGTDAITSGPMPNAPHRAAGEPRIAPWAGALLLAEWCREPKLAPWVAVIWPLVLLAGRWSLVAGRGPSAAVCLSATGLFQSGIRVSPTAATTSLSTRKRHPLRPFYPLHLSTLALSLSSPSSPSPPSPLACTPAAPTPPPPLAPCIACLPQ
jgi:hypothetical protein